MRRKSIAWKKVSRPKKNQYSEATLPDTSYYRQVEVVNFKKIYPELTEAVFRL
jgi:hypothetical protein